jgi:hypothetical protein
VLVRKKSTTMKQALERCIKECSKLAPDTPFLQRDDWDSSMTAMQLAAVLDELKPPNWPGTQRATNQDAVDTLELLLRWLPEEFLLERLDNA